MITDDDYIFFRRNLHGSPWILACQFCGVKYFLAKRPSDGIFNKF